MRVKPFLKWAGGKTQIIDKLSHQLPNNIRHIKEYYEPFIGGGALFLYVASNFTNIEKFHINDKNKDIYNCWSVIKNNHAELLNHLSLLKNKYLGLNDEQRKEMYYEIRECYNANHADNIERASFTIFLNKTCFNGLYRVNQQGKFNVPQGQYKNPEIFSTENIRSISKILKKTVVTNLDFSDIAYPSKNSFIYFDPPYRALNQTSCFNAYEQGTFDDSKQIELSNLYKVLCNNYVMLSNSDPKNIDENDNFFDNLYDKYNISRISARRVINSNKSKRGSISELLITNYQIIQQLI
ncbi:MAG: Dam family site-specific DNA-(adenine-N6)-methyltransferase [Alphaproteobacteria bacterium]|nr:Dam family site-specific DNA-(adenine-N6)-methyltransferase [Alphaproteobacteria bacterium]